MPVSRCWYGLKRVGLTQKTHVVGFNGIADILWADDMRMMIAKLNDGRL